MPQPLNSNNDVPWITRANHRIANNNYTRAEKFTMCLPMVLTNCNGYDVLVTRTDSSTRTNICIPCFIECGKIKCAIGPGAGLPGKSCCGKHRTKNIQIVPDIVTSNQASKDRAINDNVVQSNSKSIRDVSPLYVILFYLTIKTEMIFADGVWWRETQLKIVRPSLVYVRSEQASFFSSVSWFK